MNTAANFYLKVLDNAEMAQVSFQVAVLEPYLKQSGSKVSRTNTVGRIKTTSWTLDFGIARDEQSIHVPLQMLKQRLPAGEHAHWMAHVNDQLFSENFLKMQSSHACIDDGDFRNWGEEPLF